MFTRGSFDTRFIPYLEHDKKYVVHQEDGYLCVLLQLKAYSRPSSQDILPVPCNILQYTTLDPNLIAVLYYSNA